MALKRPRQVVLSDYKVPERLFADVAHRVYRELDCPRSLMLDMYLEAGEFEKLASATWIPSDYNSLESAKRAWIATEFLRKYRGMPGLDPKFRVRATLQKVAEAEDACLQANKRLRGYLHGEPIPALVASVLHRAQRKIHDMLPEYKLKAHLQACRWGPGSDAQNKRPFIGPYHKYRSVLTHTTGAREFVACLLESNHLWGSWLTNPHPASGAFTPIKGKRRGNSLLTVPKTALVDRPICVEPGANVYLQLGLGSLLRRGLLRWGIDLSSQETNRMLALEGSHDQSWATIDLSSASDTIARVLVQVLFNYSTKTRTWFRAMDKLRCYWTRYPDATWRLNHKFSSMGNGFTFELETIIFYSLVSSVADIVGGKCAAVYGDDIIVNPAIFDEVQQVLSWCGFSLNAKKSFRSGYFRESCGMNAWDGYELPSYRLEKLDSLADVYSLHNGLVRCGLSRSASWLLRRIPSRFRFFGPKGAGDAVLHTDSHESWNAKPHGLADQWFFWGLVIKGLKWVPEKVRARAYEPAILHSLATMVPLSDHTVYTGGRWGSEGFVTLSRGKWTVGELLVGREQLGLTKVEVPGLTN